MSINVKELTHIYSKGTLLEKKAIDNISFRIDTGERVAIIGATGSGKSTLIQHLNGILRPTLGSVEVNSIKIDKASKDLYKLRKEVGLVFQYPEYQLFEETIYKDIAYGPGNLSLNKNEIRKRVKESMELVGLEFEKFKDISPFDISGGEKRRVAIAGVIAMKPKILMLDEPTAGLDSISSKNLLDTIISVQEKTGITIIFISHSMNEVSKYAERIIVLQNGKIFNDGDISEIFNDGKSLNKIGLELPTVSKLINKLDNCGLNFKNNYFQLDKAVKAIVEKINKC